MVVGLLTMTAFTKPVGNQRYCSHRVGAGLMGKTGIAWKGGGFVFPEASRRSYISEELILR
jgi:hypothetical protein